MAKQNYATRPMNRLASSRAGKFAALAALAAFSLTACGSDPTSASEPAGAEPGSSANASGLACPARQAFRRGLERTGQRDHRSHRRLQRRMWRQGHDRIQPDRIWRGYQVVLQRLGRLRGLRLRTQDRG